MTTQLLAPKSEVGGATISPDDMQLRHRRERSTAQTELAFANTGHSMCAAQVTQVLYEAIRREERGCFLFLIFQKCSFTVLE